MLALLYRILSRSLRAMYRLAPVFGRLRCAVAILRDEQGFVVIDRSDGLGVALPGGISWPWESPESTVHREVFEETGLLLRNVRYLFVYRDDTFGPMEVSVFRGDFSGQPRDSWEGRVLQVSLETLHQRIMRGSESILSYLDSAPPGSA